MPWRALVLVAALAAAGCAGPAPEPAPVEVADAPGGEGSTAEFVGEIWYDSDYAVEACPLPEQARGHSFGPWVNVGGAQSVSVVFEWIPVHPVWTSVKVRWHPDRPQAGQAGVGVSAGPSSVEGVSPLTWRLPSEDLYNGSFILAGPSCAGEATPSYAVATNQTIGYRATATYPGAVPPWASSGRPLF